VPVARSVQDFAIRVLRATHPEAGTAPTSGKPEAKPGKGERDPVRRYVRYGASPRGAQALLLGAKVTALLDGRFAASCADVQKVARPALRHRLILNFEGQAEGVDADDIIGSILERTPETAADLATVAPAAAPQARGA